MLRALLRGQRQLSSGAARTADFFSLFPKTFPRGGPPHDAFRPDLRQLRKEYRSLQSEHHPDVVSGAAALAPTGGGTRTDAASSHINRAYTALRNPYTRAAHVVLLHHPDHMDITDGRVSRELIARYSAGSQANTLNYKQLLMTVLEAHEALEAAASEADLDALAAENSARIAASEAALQRLLDADSVPWDDFIVETIRVKYWVNIANGIKEWEPGKPVFLSH